MCTSYETNEHDRFEAFSLFSPPAFDYRREIYKDYFAPIFRRSSDGFSTDPASFGLIPRKRIPPHVRAYDTMNARAETIGEKRSFVGPWRGLQLCLIPCQWFYEPNYELDSKKSVRWRIGMADGSPLAIAGLWKSWEEPDDGQNLSFTMLTVNAEDHSLMKRFHKPDAEKRSVVIIPPARYSDWLSCTSTDEARSFLALYPADEMAAQPYPLPPRKDNPAPGGEDHQQSLLD